MKNIKILFTIGMFVYMALAGNAFAYRPDRGYNSYREEAQSRERSREKKYYTSSSSADLIYDSALPPLYCLGLEARDVKKIRGWVTFVNVITWIVILPVVICGFILFGSGKILMAISKVLGAFVVLRVICSTVLIGIVYWLFG